MHMPLTTNIQACDTKEKKKSHIFLLATSWLLLCRPSISFFGHSQKSLCRNKGKSWSWLYLCLFIVYLLYSKLHCLFSISFNKRGPSLPAVFSSEINSPCIYDISVGYVVCFSKWNVAEGVHSVSRQKVLEWFTVVLFPQQNYSSCLGIVIKKYAAGT